ncbi:hydroquinone glucosyltransferase-like [Triticum urartu]|uniref:Glycosyltransferase n=1 Tax=Triticum urartu TaxID=4572 RepID=A0A8R7TMN8_TRIUA|nr:hydroquinone glucosyltransferase-like [Triticum urartu]
MEETGTERLAPRPHVVLLASPGAGHLIPLAELAWRLVDHHGFAATLVTFTDLSSPDALSGVPATVATAALPSVPLDDLPAGTPMETVLFELVHRSLPSLRALLRSVGAPLAALVPDFFCSSALPLAAELGVPGYVFVPSNLTTIALMRATVELHDGVPPGEYRDLPDPLELPGGVSLRRTDLPRSFQSSGKPVYAHLMEEGRRYLRADGLLVNTFYELEPATVEEFKQAAERGALPPVFPVGPFVRPSTTTDEAAGASACIEWLDRQPTGSVVYVSFGSGGALTVEQTAELAAGLEASGHRFLWVVRMPNLDGHDHEDKQNPLAWLPEGFLGRTADKGLAVAAWAPQVRVLSHPATAVFVSHCGWNSALESVAAGVPMVAWPLYAEQRMNAVVLEGSVGVALRPRARERGEIAAVVRELMEGADKGRAVRRQAGDLQQAAARAWSPEGSSRRALEQAAATWKKVTLAKVK